MDNPMLSFTEVNKIIIFAMFGMPTSKIDTNTYKVILKDENKGLSFEQLMGVLPEGIIGKIEVNKHSPFTIKYSFVIDERAASEVYKELLVSGYILKE